VLFFSDNGPNSSRWNGGMKGRKASVDEGGVRSPLMVRWPGRIKPGTVVTEIAGAIDLLPTLSALTGVPPAAGAKPVDGVDLSPLLLAAGAGADASAAAYAGAGGARPRVARADDLLPPERQDQRTDPAVRLDPTGALFDMAADPGQTKDVAADQPEVAAKLAKAVADWRTDVLGGALGQATAPGGGGGRRGGQKAGGNAAGGAAADPRPFPVGYAEFPMTPLPARDGVPHGGVKRSAAAPNCSYFVNWTSPQDAITWDVEVNTPGEYDVTVYYTCPEADAGSTVELAFKGAKATGKVAPGWDPPLYANQDTIPRPAVESPMKAFRPLSLGTVRLDRGRDALTLRALEVPGKSVMDVRMVTLTLKPSNAGAARP
jgi:hypothetical protein